MQIRVKIRYRKVYMFGAHIHRNKFKIFTSMTYGKTTAQSERFSRRCSSECAPFLADLIWQLLTLTVSHLYPDGRLVVVEVPAIELEELE